MFIISKSRQNNASTASYTITILTSHTIISLTTLVSYTLIFNTYHQGHGVTAHSRCQRRLFRQNHNDGNHARTNHIPIYKHCYRHLILLHRPTREVLDSQDGGVNQDKEGPGREVLLLGVKGPELLLLSGLHHLRLGGIELHLPVGQVRGPSVRSNHHEIYSTNRHI